MALFRIKEKIVFFVHIPKTGGSSIETALAELGPICLHEKPVHTMIPPQHWHAEIFETTIPKNFYDFGFLICRNPFTRVLSEYRHYSRKSLKKGSFVPISFDDWMSATLAEYKINPYIRANHMRPQIDYMSDGIRIFRYEDGLQEVIAYISKYTGAGLTPKIAHKKKSEKTALTIKKNTLDHIRSFYAQDFLNINYDPHDLGFIERENIQISG